MEIEPLYKYSSNRAFAFHANHQGSLLFRTGKPNSHSELFPKYETTDLIFLDVIYQDLPTELYGFKVTKPRDKKAHKISELYDDAHHDSPAERVYAIDSRWVRFHVVASSCWILEHNKPMIDSGLSVTAINDLSLRDAYISSHVKRWYRIDGKASRKCLLELLKKWV